MLHEHRLHLRVGARQLGIAVGKEDEGEGDAKDQQTERSKGVQKSHGAPQPTATIVPKTQCEIQKGRILERPCPGIRSIG